MTDMTGQTAVVTGASQGIGLACALALLAHNARVVAVARDKDKLKRVFEEYGDRVIPMAADLLDRETRLNLVPKILDQTGQIDTFVANAGLYVGGDFIKNDPEEIEGVLTVDINGVITPIHGALKHMVERGSGDVIVIGSIAGRRDPLYEPVYAPSKWAVEKFVDLTRTQVCKKGVRVASISPGPTDTPLVDSWEPERLAQARATQQFIAAKDVSDVMMFMLSRPRHVAWSNVSGGPTAFNLI